jgi:hypothetical protein
MLLKFGIWNPWNPRLYWGVPFEQKKEDSRQLSSYKNVYFLIICCLLRQFVIVQRCAKIVICQVTQGEACDKQKSRDILASNKPQSVKKGLIERNLRKGMNIKRLFLHLLLLANRCERIYHRILFGLPKGENQKHRLIFVKFYFLLLHKVLIMRKLVELQGRFSKFM